MLVSSIALIVSACAAVIVFVIARAQNCVIVVVIANVIIIYIVRGLHSYVRRRDIRTER